MNTSIIILTCNGIEYTRNCIDSIRVYTPPGEYEIIVVDNGSTDETTSWLSEQDDLRVIYNRENAGFPRGCNQGLELATGDNLLLLNNDTVVTPRWLEQLLACLYSDERIGAAGPVTNSASYFTALDAPYDSLEEMLAFADRYNRSDPAKWEERLKLIGFCLLMKREVYEKVGGLDERFTPGNYEDDDLCLRIRKAGYRIKICTDTFIHHEGSVSFRRDPEAYYALMQANKEKFVQKWGFSPDYSLGIRLDILQLIDEPKLSPIRVLEIGCACGGTLLELKNWYPNAEVYGIELNPHAAEAASWIADVRTGNIETMEIGTANDWFDYIIFADVLEHLGEPWEVLRKALPCLKPSGKVLASIPNVGHYSVIRDLLKGRWNYTDRGLLDITHVRFFTGESICRLFSGTGYQAIELRHNSIQPLPEDERWMDAMEQTEGSEMRTEWMVYQYVVKAFRNPPSACTPGAEGYEQLKRLIRRLEWDIDSAEAGRELAVLFGQRRVNAEELGRLIARCSVSPAKAALRTAEALMRHGHASSTEELLETFRKDAGPE